MQLSLQVATPISRAPVSTDLNSQMLLLFSINVQSSWDTLPQCACTAFSISCVRRYTCLLATCRSGVNVFRARAAHSGPPGSPLAGGAYRGDQGRFDFAFAKSLDEVAAVGDCAVAVRPQAHIYPATCPALLLRPARIAAAFLA